jgi:EAL domain-containing protein (putative c-di-GMP-specific phosphodiesterase class I)
MSDEFVVLTDRGGRLSTVTDDAAAAVGQSGQDLRTRPLFDLFAADSRDALATALRTAPANAAMSLGRHTILTGTDREASFDVSIEPAPGNRFWVRFKPAGEVVEEPGPLAKDKFLDAVSHRLGLPGSDEMRLFMVDFDGLRDAELSRRLGENGLRDMRSTIEEALGEASGGNPVGRLDASSYGVMGRADQAESDVVSSVVSAVERLGVSSAELGARSESVSLDAVSEDEPGGMRRLLSHVCHKFYETVRHGAEFGSERLSEVAEEVKQAIRLIETALDRNDLVTPSREVRMLATGDVKMVLASGELVFGDEQVPANRILVLADHRDLCCRHDRAVAQAALADIAGTDTQAPVIIDIYAPTLESGEASAIAADAAKAGRAIGFRPQGIDIAAARSPAVRQVYKLLSDGVPVWLSNFSTAIAKTRQLQGAFVEVSATLLRDISAQPNRDALLSGLLKVWNDVEVNLVATNVDSKNLASFSSRLGIAFGIGIAADPAADAPQSTRDVAR